MGYKRLAQMPARRNGPVSSDVRPHQMPSVNTGSATVSSGKSKFITVRRCALQVKFTSKSGGSR